MELDSVKARARLYRLRHGFDRELLLPGRLWTMVLAAYPFLMYLSWNCTDTYREWGGRSRGRLLFILLLIGWVAVTLGLALWLEWDVLDHLGHILFSGAACAIGVGLSHLRISRKVLDASNRYGGRTIQEDVRLRSASDRFRSVHHFNASGDRKQLDSFDYERGSWRLRTSTFDHRPGYCMREEFDREGRVVLREEVNVETSGRTSIEFPLGEEAAGEILARRLPCFNRVTE